MRISFSPQGLRDYKWLVLPPLLLIVAVACFSSGQADQSLIQTQTALQVQLTLQAQQVNQDAQETAAAFERTRIAQEVQATVLAEQAAQLTQQARQVAPTNPPPLPPTEALPPLPPSPASTVDIEQKIKNAKILLFEDVAGTGILEYYQEALESGGYTFKDDGSAQGWFKDDLLSSTEWDLIIAASESRTKIQGEFFVYLLEQINRGAAVIIEHWALDELSQGRVAPLLAKCGIGIYRDWYFEDWWLADLSVYPLLPDHPLFTTPNKGVSLRNFSVFWETPDQGDLLKLTGSGDAQLIAGTIATSKSDHGVVASCIEGRVIIQTFSSHNYRRDMVTSLIQNYVHYTLTNRFLYQP